MANTVDETEIIKAAGKQLTSDPSVLVALFFMFLCGIVIRPVFVDNKMGFEKVSNTPSKFCYLAWGFLPCSIVMNGHHLFIYRELVTDLPDLAQSALPSSIILGGIVCTAVIFKLFFGVIVSIRRSSL